jgi:broad specificity phosphatase PhoE
MRLFLLRHAQSEGNKLGLFQGKLDFPLSEEGKKQSREAGIFLKENFGFDAIISSPQKRALETAEIVADILNLPVKVDERLKEISYGILEGKKQSEVENWEPYLKWLENPVKYPLEGVDDFEQLRERLESFLKYAYGRYEKPLIITHGGIVRAFICLLGNFGFERLWRFSVGNVSLSMVEVKSLKPLKGKIKFVNLPTIGFGKV